MLFMSLWLFVTHFSSTVHACNAFLSFVSKSTDTTKYHRQRSFTDTYNFFVMTSLKEILNIWSVWKLFEKCKNVLKVNGCLDATSWQLFSRFPIQLKIKPLILTFNFPSPFSHLLSLPTQTILPTKLSALQTLFRLFFLCSFNHFPLSSMLLFTTGHIFSLLL